MHYLYIVQQIHDMYNIYNDELQLQELHYYHYWILWIEYLLNLNFVYHYNIHFLILLILLIHVHIYVLIHNNLEYIHVVLLNGVVILVLCFQDQYLLCIYYDIINCIVLISNMFSPMATRNDSCYWDSTENIN